MGRTRLCSPLVSSFSLRTYVLVCTAPYRRYPIFESWFFACIPRSPLVSAWRDEFMQLQNHKSATQYIAALRAEGVDLQNLGEG